MVKEIVFVCTGNTCRSPMAEGLMKELLKNRDDIKISSCGVAAMAGDDAAENAVLALKELGIDISGHRSQGFRKEKYSVDALFVTMSAGHANLLKQLGAAEKNIITLNVDDPYGQGIEVYRVTRDQIRGKLEKLIEDLGINTDEA